MAPRFRIVLAVAAAMGLLGSLGPSGAQTAALTATVEDFPAVVSKYAWPHYSGRGTSLGNAGWRVVAGTGNCCENYLGADDKGRLMDFGGTFLNFSDDKGRTWKTVTAPDIAHNGEGAVSMAPNGDILGIGWNPYSGDHTQAFKYDVKGEQWYWTENIVHTPFYDREWVSAIEGPFTVAGQTVPYVSVMTGSIYKELYYYSLDGLNYFLPSSKVGDEQTQTPVKKALKLKPRASADWIQPITSFGITPLPGGGAIARDVSGILSNQWALLEPGELSWKPFEFPTPIPPGRIQADSRARMHHISWHKKGSRFVYRVSDDGGRSWVKTPIDLPAGFSVEEWDFRANAAVGITALGVHAHHQEREIDQDFVYEFSNRELKPKLKRLYYVGAGDIAVGRGLGANLRFDFATVAIMPDKTIATSFVDQAHTEPTLAILKR